MTLHEHADDFSALAELAEAFGSLVETLHQGHKVTLSPRRIVEVAARCMPRSQHVGLVATDHDRVTSVAATSDISARLDRIRAEAGEGPAWDVLDTNDLICSNDLRADPRWPQFGARVAEETGIRSVVSYRLYISARHRAALSFYSDWPHAFDDLAIATGAIFAAYGSLTLTSTLLTDEPVAHRRSDDVHREIGVAVGILMSTADLTTQSAYLRLHAASQELRRSLPAVAQYVISHRRFPDGGPG